MNATGISANASCCTASAAGAKISLSAANMTFIAAEAPVNTCAATTMDKSASINLVNISLTLASGRLDAGNAFVIFGNESRLSGV